MLILHIYSIIGIMIISINLLVILTSDKIFKSRLRGFVVATYIALILSGLIWPYYIFHCIRMELK